MNLFRHTLAPALIATALFAGAVHSAPLLTLGPASPFNTFVLGDMHHEYSDVEGALAVGGNVQLQHYAVGMLLDGGADHTDTFVVGGNVEFSHGRLYHGNLVHAGEASVAHVGLYGGDDPSQAGGSVRQDSVFDFAAAASELQALSQGYAGLEANGSATFSEWGGELRLVGNNPLLNIFTLDVESLAHLRFDLVVPDGAWALINFTSSVVSLNNFGFHFGETGARIDDNFRHDGQLTGRTLFNFASASSLSIHALALPGSVLAPFADVSFYNARIDGQLVAGSLSGAPGGGANCLSDHTLCSGQTNWYPFIPMSAGDPVALNSVPEPQTLALVLVVLAIMVLPVFRRSIAPRTTRP